MPPPSLFVSVCVALCGAKMHILCLRFMSTSVSLASLQKVLFPLLSRYLIREVESNFPVNPDKVTLVFLSPQLALA